MPKAFHLSPFGEAAHCWVNKPDMAFQAAGAAGVYKVDLVCSGPEALEFKAKVDAEVDAAWDRFWKADAESGKPMPAKERKLWTKKPPYHVDTDDDDNPTGFIIFDFRQNASISYKDTNGERVTKAITIGIRDSDDKLVEVQVWPKSELRVMYTFRDSKVVGNHWIGTRLDFGSVQVRKLVQGSGGQSDQGFGKVDGGYITESGAEGKTAEHAGGTDKDDGGDY